MSFNIHKYQDYCKYKPLTDCDIDVKYLVDKLTPIYRIENFVGSGEYGITFKCDTNKILKITTDISESYYANILCNKDFSNLCHVYDVKSHTNKVYIILYQMLNPIKDINERQFLSDFYHHYIHNHHENLPPFDGIDKFFTKYEKSFLSKRFRWILNQLENIFEQCNNIGIKFIDCHQDNLGYNNKGNLCLFDIGNHKGNYDLNDIETINLN
jgi:hypothetical protein